MIEQIVNPKLPTVGERIEGTVVSTTTFGAFVNISPGRDGLIHISKLGRGKRISSVEDAVRVGDHLTVEVQEVDPDGRRISLKPVGPDWDPPEGGWPKPEGDEAEADRPRPPRRDGGGRGDRRDRGFRPRGDRSGDRPDR
jgi:polyribonucleotide nucleotidyltransferase